MTIKDFKNKVTKLKPVTPWENINIQTVYHIPKLMALQPRDLLIIKKEGDTIHYIRLGDKTKKQCQLKKTSVFAKFLVKRKKF